MPAHQNHHYVPAFLLREWEREEKKLSQFSWENGTFRMFRRQAKSVAKVKHLYSTLRHLTAPDVQIERDVMGPKVDDPAAIVHKKLLAGGVGRLTSSEQEDWARFIVSLFLRGPTAIADLRNRGRDTLAAGLTAAVERVSLLDNPPALSLAEWAQHENPSTFEDLGIQTLERLITSKVLNQKLLAATWGTVKRRGAPHEFLISDKPLVRVGENLDGRFLICLPLSPEQAFVAYSAQDIGKTLAERSTSSFVKALNFNTVCNAERYVYSTSALQTDFVRKHLASSGATR